MQVIVDGPENAKATYLFAHGAGGAMDTPWMTRVARGIAERGIRVVRFEFPYMAARRTGKKSGAPDRPPVLLDTFRNLIEEFGGGGNVAIGGKSMGGRMATMVADETNVRGVVVFGYPFHPPGKREQLRTAHLETLRTPALILQGERDPFGTKDEVRIYRLSPSIRVSWLEDGDHSLKPRARGGLSEAGNLARAVTEGADFLLEIFTARRKS
jgi:uncharacterized protein